MSRQSQRIKDRLQIQMLNRLQSDKKGFIQTLQHAKEQMDEYETMYYAYKHIQSRMESEGTSYYMKHFSYPDEVDDDDELLECEDAEKFEAIVDYRIHEFNNKMDEQCERNCELRQKIVSLQQQIDLILGKSRDMAIAKVEDSV